MKFSVENVSVMTLCMTHNAVTSSYKTDSCKILLKIDIYDHTHDLLIFRTTGWKLEHNFLSIHHKFADMLLEINDIEITLS